MSTLAIISDLHSNIESLTEVLKDIEAQGIRDIVCLGDVIGYGPNPRDVLRHALNWRWCLRGNHEDALLFLAMDFNPEAARAIDWTRTQINAKEAPKEENHTFWNFLGGLTDQQEENGVQFVHASTTPGMTTKEYVRPIDAGNPKKLSGIFDRIRKVCFYGHTHEPGVFTQDYKFYTPAAFNGKFKLAEGRKYFVNVGSTGQPRDGDTRCCYVTFDGEVITFRRLEYDYKATMKKIYDTQQIPRRFADRLEKGR